MSASHSGCQERGFEFLGYTAVGVASPLSGRLPMPGTTLGPDPSKTSILERKALLRVRLATVTGSLSERRADRSAESR